MISTLPEGFIVFYNLEEPYYHTTGRKSLPPGVYFRMLIIGYFEDISSHRAIASRWEDSQLLGYGPGEDIPDHSTLSLTRTRLPKDIHDLAFELVLAATQKYDLRKGKTIGVDATDVETEVIVTAEVYHGDQGDTTTIEDTVIAAQTHLNNVQTDGDIEDVVADKGYHSEDCLDRLQNEIDQRTHIPEKKQKERCKTKEKPVRLHEAHRRDKRNVNGKRIEEILLPCLAGVPVPSCNHVRDYMPFHVRQSHIAAAETEGGACVIYTHQVQHRGMQVVNFDTVLDCLVAKFVSGPVNCAWLYTATGHPDGEAILVVVASIFSLSEWSASEFASPHH